MMNSKYTQLYRAVYYLTATDNDMSELPELLKHFPIPDSVKKDLLQATKFEKIYRRDGVIVLKNILSPRRVGDAVNDIWKYILSLPYKKKVKYIRLSSSGVSYGRRSVGKWNIFYRNRRTQR